MTMDTNDKKGAEHEVNLNSLVGLSKAQQRTIKKLSNDWKCSYELGESMATLNALCRKKVAESKGHGDCGCMFSPQTTIKYRLYNA